MFQDWNDEDWADLDKLMEEGEDEDGISNEDGGQGEEEVRKGK